MLESLFGIPSHVFFVHAPVVLIPAVGLAAAVYAAWWNAPQWFGWGVLAAAVGTTVATFLAVQSGEEFEKLLQGVPIEKHESLARTTLLLTIGLVLAILALQALRISDRRRDTRRGPTLNASLALATAALSILSVVWVVRTGHEGARVTWDGVIPEDAVTE